MNRIPLDVYDDKPTSMKRYLKYYGQHFNKKLCEFAISKMDHGKVKISKDKIDDIMNKYNIKL
jgi:hypothetical protein